VDLTFRKGMLVASISALLIVYVGTGKVEF
jgi:hypothetical protein